MIMLTAGPPILDISKRVEEAARSIQLNFSECCICRFVHHAPEDCWMIRDLVVIENTERMVLNYPLGWVLCPQGHFYQVIVRIR